VLLEMLEINGRFLVAGSSCGGHRNISRAFSSLENYHTPTRPQCRLTQLPRTVLTTMCAMLGCSKPLLDNLPLSQLPAKTALESNFGDFLKFQPDPDILERTGYEVSPLSEYLKRASPVASASTVGTAGAGSTLSIKFKVNPNIDLKSAALRDMISREPIVLEQAIAPVQNPSQPGQGGHMLTVDEAFAEW